jgi:hypothetical protein
LAAAATVFNLLPAERVNASLTSAVQQNELGQVFVKVIQPYKTRQLTAKLLSKPVR